MSYVACHEQTPLDIALPLGVAALAECGDDRALRIECLLHNVVGHEITGRFAAAQRFAAEALTLLDDDTDEELRISTLAAVGDLESRVTPGGGRDRLRRAMAIEGDRAIPHPDMSPTTCLGRALHFSDELDEGRELLQRAAQASSGAHVPTRTSRSPSASRARNTIRTWEARSPRSLVAAHEGDAALARTLAGRGLSIAESIGDRAYGMHHHRVLGFLELSVGDPLAALHHLETLPQQLAEAGICELGLQPCYPDLIEALIAADRRADAAARLEAWEAFGNRYDRAAALCTAARAHGLLAAHDGDRDTAIEHLERALELHDRLPVPLERGRTLLALGSARRGAKQRRAARETLKEAHAVFDGMGAAIWARRAEVEAGRVSGRVAGDRTAPTPTERQVARLVAAGRTNREVAQELFVSVRNVESHLTRIYAKLDVRSRAELAARHQRG